MERDPELELKFLVRALGMKSLVKRQQGGLLLIVGSTNEVDGHYVTEALEGWLNHSRTLLVDGVWTEVFYPFVLEFREVGPLRYQLVARRKK